MYRFCQLFTTYHDKIYVLHLFWRDNSDQLTECFVWLRESLVSSARPTRQQHLVLARFPLDFVLCRQQGGQKCISKDMKYYPRAFLKKLQLTHKQRPTKQTKGVDPLMFSTGKPAPLVCFFDHLHQTAVKQARCALMHGNCQEL
jgi:hypothetical protein